MMENSIPFAGKLIIDGKIHRFSAHQKQDVRDEWYVAWEGTSNKENPWICCVYGTWSKGGEKYCYKSWEEFSGRFDLAEQKEFSKIWEQKRKGFEKKEAKEKQDRLRKAQKIWKGALELPKTDFHKQYLQLKQVRAHGIKYGYDYQRSEVLIIPLKNLEGEIQGVQFVYAQGRKKIHGIKTGNFHLLGEVDSDSTIYVAEGYATGATIHEATGKSVVIAFDCYNLDSVVAALRHKHPKNPIVICGDDDIGNPKNPGRSKAEEVARKHQATVVFPIFPDGKQKDANEKVYTDFNDLAMIAGIDEVKDQLNGLSIPDWVAQFNKTHAVIHTGQTYILTEKYDPQLKRDIFSLESVPSFHTWYKPKKDPSGKQALSKLWIEHPCRREYRGITFDPSIKSHFGGYYNLFQGFPIEPRQGECALFWKLIKEGLCACCEVKYLYVRKWLAHMMQRPWELPETAIAFRGQQGIGKGTILQYLARLVGKHYLELVQMEQVVGRFNGHLKDVILVYANEAVWGGSKSAAGALKGMITDPYQAIELKGKDIMTIQNFKRLLLSSNEDWIVPRDIDDRRFFVIDCSIRFKEDHQFFKELHAQMVNGGIEALMFDLMHENICDWHPRKMPIIADGFDLKIRGMNSPHQWLYYALRDGKMIIDDHNDTWPLNDSFEASKSRVYNNYKLYCEDKKEKPEHDGLFWKRVREVLGELHEQKPHGLPRTIKFPALLIARGMFQKHAKAEAGSLWEY
jgi:putative DNA primase/helicase